MEVTSWVVWSQVIPSQWQGVGSAEDQVVRVWVGSEVMADLAYS